MARLPHLYMEGCSQYIIQRGNNRQACFLSLGCGGWWFEWFGLQ